jgi:hypothetical protein
LSGFVKIYESILDSSIWSESASTRLVWITMLAMADQHGLVEASVGGLARRAQVSREDCEAALLVLSSPDPDDKSGVDEGRRIHRVEGRGWRITNHAAYREIRTEKQVKTAARVAKHRANKQTPSVTVTPVTRANAPSRSVRPESEADRDPDPFQEPPPKDLTGRRDEPPSGVVVVAQPTEVKVPCPADLELTDGQRSQLTMGNGMSDYQVAELSRRFRAKACADTSDLRTLVTWRKCMAAAVASEFTHPRRRPPRSPDEETEGQRRDRLRSGPRQPNAHDHTDDQAHLRAIGGTVV